MNEQRVCLEDGTKLDAWRCGICGTIYSGRAEDVAASCCRCQDCGAICDPKVLRKRTTICDTCWGPHYAKLDQDRLDRATVVENYTGPVCIDDRFWPSLEEMIDSLDADETPEFVHTCTVRHNTIDAGDIICNLIENASLEDAPDLDGVKEFEAACAAFNEANAGQEYWEEDSKHKIRVASYAESVKG